MTHSARLFHTAVASALLLSATSSAAHAQVTGSNNATTWKTDAPCWEGYAFDEDYPGVVAGGICLSTNPTIALGGGTVTVRAFDNVGNMICAIRDQSNVSAVSDGYIHTFSMSHGSIELTFSPDITAFFTYFAGIDAFQNGELRLYNASNALVATLFTQTSISTLAYGVGFTSTVPIRRIVARADGNDSAALLGAFTGLASGVQSLGTINIPGYPGPAGATVQLDLGVRFIPASLSVPGDVATIQMAINCGAQEIVVAPGTYNEAINFGGRAIHLRSTVGPGVTTLSGAGLGDISVITCESGEGPGTIVEGFTITGGLGRIVGPDRVGGGMYVLNSSPTVTDCIFDTNGMSGAAGTIGGGMYVKNGSPAITGTDFDSNDGLHSAALFIENGDSVITDCLFRLNADGAVRTVAGSDTSLTGCTWNINFRDSALLNQDSTLTLTDCLFNLNADVNPPSNGAALRSEGASATLIMTRCEFRNNTSAEFGGAIAILGGQVTARDCTFDDNDADFSGGAVDATYGASGNFSNCLFHDNSAGVGGAVHAYSSGALNLRNCTFSVNSSSNGAALAVRELSTVNVYNSILWGNGPGSEIVVENSTLAVTYCDVEGGFAGTGNISANPLFVSVPMRNFRLGSCSPAVDAGRESDILAGVTTDLGGDPRRVDDAGVLDTGLGTPPIVDMGAYERQTDSALPPIANVPGDAPTIQAAINCGADEIIVAPGTYNEIVNFLGRAIILRSSGGAAVTTINGGGAGTVVTCSAGEVDGFTITGGNGFVSGGMYVTGSPTITNCTFSGNTATAVGGGMIVDGGSPAVTNCTFSGNTTNQGGGMYVAGSPTITNCTFSGNIAANDGGGMHVFFGSPTITNCTFSGNTASDLGGGMHVFSFASPTITNCILWGNTPNQIDGTVTVTSSNVQGGAPGGGTGNINADPLFVNAAGGDLHISAGSPCIDAANNSAPGLAGITTDLDGNPRFVNDPATADTGMGTPPIVDMGAFEYQPPCPADCAPPPDGSVNVTDLLALLAQWGASGGGGCDIAPPPGGDGVVNVSDLLALLAAWGLCP